MLLDSKRRHAGGPNRKCSGYTLKMPIMLWWWFLGKGGYANEYM